MPTTTLPAGTTTYTSHTTVAAGDTLRMDPTLSTLLVMDHANLIVEGLFEMKPNPGVTHELRFLCEDESFGAGGGTEVVATDIGLWVMGAGRLDIQGTPKVGWNNTGTDATWLPGDTTLRAPNAPPDAGTAWYAAAFAHTQGAAVPFVTAPNGRVFPTEVFNLTRNVIIGGQPPTGTVHHRSHVKIRSTVPSTIKYATFQWLSPRKYDPTRPNDNAYSKVVVGRWALHHHDNMDGSRGTVIEGCVLRNFGAHGYVPHMSHGISYLDCIAFGGNASGFWWDLDDSLSSDILFDHCLVNTIAPFRDLQVAGAPGFSLSEGGGTGYLDGRGSNIIRNCVASGVRGTQNNAGFMWTTVADPSIGSDAVSETWTTENNIAHNNLNSGVFTWYNVTTKHLIDDQVCYHNGRDAVLHGAYAVTFMWDRILCFGNVRRFEIHAVSHYPDANHDMPGSFIRDSWIDGLATAKHEVPSGLFAAPRPRYTVIDTTIDRSIVISDFENTLPPPGVPPPGNQEEIYLDFVRCLNGSGNDIEPSDFALVWMHPLSQWRVQRRNGTAYQLTEAVPSGALVSTVIAPFALNITTPSIPHPTLGTAYSQVLTASPGGGPGITFSTPPYVWTLNAGTLPPGLTLSPGGTISGTPTTPGDYDFTVRVTDSFVSDGEAHPNYSLKDFSLSVTGAPVLQITSTDLDDGIIGTAYSDAVDSTGGNPPRTFALAPGSGPLPPGLVLSTGGGITGTPTTAGSYSFTVRVTDNVGATDDQAFTVDIVNLNPSISSPLTLPPGELTIAYGQQLVATGGTGPYTFASILGPMPPSVGISANGLISGTSTNPGSYPVRIRVTDALGRIGVRDYTIDIYLALVFPDAVLPGANVGRSYFVDLVASDGVTPYTFEVLLFPGEEDPLPPGLTLTVNGILSGVPTEEGTFVFGVEVIDSLGAIDAGGAQITVGPPTATLERLKTRSLRMRGEESRSRQRGALA